MKKKFLSFCLAASTLILFCGCNSFTMNALLRDQEEIADIRIYFSDLESTGHALKKEDFSRFSEFFSNARFREADETITRLDSLRVSYSFTDNTGSSFYVNKDGIVFCFSESICYSTKADTVNYDELYGYLKNYFNMNH